MPELSNTLPLTPDVPALAVSNDREPLLFCVPEPVVTVMAPPADEDADPALIMIDPLAVVGEEPEPAVTYT